MKNSSDTIGNQTRGLPACSAVPQPTAPPRTRIVEYTGHKFGVLKKDRMLFQADLLLELWYRSC